MHLPKRSFSHPSRLFTVISLALVASCSESSPSGAPSPASPPPAKPNKEAPSEPGPSPKETGNRQKPSNIACKDLDLSSNQDFQTLRAAGLKITLDCKDLEAATWLSGAIEGVLKEKIPATLTAVRSSLSSIKSLPAAPSTLVLGSYSVRSTSGEPWRLNANVEDAAVEIQRYVAREQQFQATEEQLFGGRIRLIDGGNIGSSTRPIPKPEFDKAVNVLRGLADLLKRSQAAGEVSVVKLPLGTNQTKSLADLSYTAKFQVLEIPYEAPREGLDNYIQTIVPKLSQLTNQLSGASLSANPSAFMTQSQLATLQMDSTTPEQAVNIFSDATSRQEKILNQLVKLATKISNVLTKNNLKSLDLANASSFRTLHRIQGQNLILYVSKSRDGLFLEEVDFTAVDKCLISMADSPSDTESACLVR